MTLGEKQRKFTFLVARLIKHAYEDLGYELSFGEAYRTPEQAALNAQKGIGVANSLHTIRLAIDLNLFIEGQYISGTEAYRPLGEYWESLDPDCVWGGRFARADGNHFGYTYNGVK